MCSTKCASPGTSTGSDKEPTLTSNPAADYFASGSLTIKTRS